ncbi:type II/IV secretion system protein [Candidatus Uhrbacteria bacterium]|nr:type II/IV secretion system protein [Candidatus Uhrbacteria bacterium]
MSGIYDQEVLIDLQKRGILNPKQAAQAWQETLASQKGLEGLLMEKSWVKEEEITKSKGEVYHIPYFDLAGKSVPPATLNTIQEDIAQNYQMIAFDKTDDELKVGLVDPLNLKAIEAAEFIAKKNNLRVSYFIVSPTNFANALKLYKALGEEVGEALEAAEEKFKPTDELSAEGLEGLNLEKVIKSAPVSKIVSLIIKHAIDSKASDIHIEPTPDGSKIRYRVDGMLRIALVLPNYLHGPIVSRLKVLASLKLDETRKPQDGRIRTLIGNQKVDLRISTMPLIETEKIVIRILDTSGVVLTLEQLGLRPKFVKQINVAIRRPYGLFLVTGPTGAGKSTTLYSTLNLLNSESVNIVTLEDPAEYFIPGVNQSQVNPDVGYTFAAGLRSMLRQDPDIMMVGEIRDSETAELAVHAALTGHIVFATLHTNDALGAVPRLMDLKVEPFLISSVLTAVMSQRLVRKICPDCKKAVKATPEIDKQIKDELKKLAADDRPKIEWNKDLTLYQGAGCNKCRNSGYKGRTPIAEVFTVTDEMKKIISSGFKMEAVATELGHQAVVRMRQDGFLKAIEGVTSISEVFRVMQE